MTPDPDPDVDTNTPLLGVVHPPSSPLTEADQYVRQAAARVTQDLERLRCERADRDREGLAQIETLRRRLIEDRAAINARIKALVGERARLARVLRVLDK